MTDPLTAPAQAQALEGFYKDAGRGLSGELWQRCRVCHKAWADRGFSIGPQHHLPCPVAELERAIAAARLRSAETRPQWEQLKQRIKTARIPAGTPSAQISAAEREQDQLLRTIQKWMTDLEAAPALPGETPAEPPVTADTSDGYHTFRELYEYRKAFNALLFNEWARLGVNDVHKSRRHSDGEACFGGGWFIVVAQTAEGQISNHYKDEDWALFQLPERERGAEYDGHTPMVALERMLRLAAPGDAGPATPPLAERLTDEQLDAAYEAFWAECDDVAGPPSAQTGPTLKAARAAMRAVLLAALTPRQE